MPDEPSLEGWAPDPDGKLSVAEVVDLAFEYRGDVTVEFVDGTHFTGYVFNRDTHGERAAQSRLEIIETATGQSRSVPYDSVARIRFTGKDMAAGNSYEAWKRRRDAQSRSAKESTKETAKE
jgi:hypothetical protein